MASQHRVYVLDAADRSSSSGPVVPIRRGRAIARDPDLEQRLDLPVEVLLDGRHARVPELHSPRAHLKSQTYDQTGTAFQHQPLGRAHLRACRGRPGARERVPVPRMWNALGPINNGTARRTVWLPPTFPPSGGSRSARQPYRWLAVAGAFSLTAGGVSAGSGGSGAPARQRRRSSSCLDALPKMKPGGSIAIASRVARNGMRMLLPPLGALPHRVRCRTGSSLAATHTPSRRCGYSH